MKDVDAFAGMPSLGPDEYVVRRGLVTLAADSGVKPGVMVVTDQRVMVATSEATGTALVFSAARAHVRLGWAIEGGPAEEFAVSTGTKGATTRSPWVRRHPDSPEDALALFEAINDGPLPDEPPPVVATPAGPWLRWRRWVTTRRRRHR